MRHLPIWATLATRTERTERTIALFVRRRTNIHLDERNKRTRALFVVRLFDDQPGLIDPGEMGRCLPEGMTYVPDLGKGTAVPKHSQLRALVTACSFCLFIAWKQVDRIPTKPAEISKGRLYIHQHHISTHRLPPSRSPSFSNSLTLSSTLRTPPSKSRTACSTSSTLPFNAPTS